ncbi:MAG TPA: hypothetical protein PKY29_08430 [Ferruginibacter sp.]|nr:hypothetical protein [Ferruginibacter sp.]HRN79301.1 hypothetical protein [Ferruginibacter sp.]HRO18116.1 hypothetical protein [Ferruginibacter sp.]HRQ21328.1 hypothetical protein [Ferruginibacter sp.]
MKQLLVIICFLVQLNTHAQQVFITARDFDNLPDTALVFLAALWCSPCVEKQNYFEATVKEYPKIPYVAIYDTRYYNEKRHAKILKHTPPGPMYFWAEPYYTKIQKSKLMYETNPLKWLVPDLEKHGYTLKGKEKIWYGQAMLKQGKHIQIFTQKDQPRKYVPLVLKTFDVHVTFDKAKRAK